MDYQEFLKSKHSKLVCDILSELALAQLNYSAFHSSHEGYATILEELDELWAEIKLRPEKRSTKKMRKEAIQVAAMAVRFIIDICDRDPKDGIS